MLRLLSALTTLLAMGGTVLAQTSEKRWPENAKWPEAVDGVRIEVKPDLGEVEVPNDRLASRFRADEIRFVLDLPAEDTFVPNVANVRFIRFSAWTGEVTVPPLTASTLVTREPAVYAATPPASWLGFRPEERFAILARIQRAGHNVWYAFAVSRRTVAPRTPVLSKPEVSPTLAPAQQLLDGRTTVVARLSFRETVSNIVPNQHGTWFDLVLDGTFSTSMLDPDAYSRLELQVGRAFGARSLNRLGFEVGALTTQAGRTSTGYANLSATYVTPGRFARPSHTLIVGAAPVIAVGIRAEQRWRRDGDVSPYHIKPVLSYGFLRAQVGPLWLFPRNGHTGSFDRDCALFVDLGGFWIPDDESKAGLETRRLETSFGMSLTFPTRILIFSPEIFFRTGAIEGQSFARTSIFGLGLSARF